MSSGATHDRPITVRAAGTKHRDSKYVVGKFPMGAPAVLKQSSTKWKLHKDKPEAIPPRRRHSAPQQDATPWLLEDQAGNVTHKGQLEGGITASNYFLLVKEKEVFTALPLTAWYNFKPPPRRVAMSLEEAEAEMEKKHNSHFSGTGRLSRAIAANEVKGALDAGPDEGGAMGHDSDEEEKRANRARAANADQGSTAEGRNQDAATDVNVIKGDKSAEDWEYEENAADDDDDMGEQDDANNRDASPPPRETPATSQDPSREDQEAEENDKNLSKHGRELQRLLKNTGLSESDEEDVKEDTSLMTDDEDEDEMEDLDALAKGLDHKPKAASAAETGRRRSPTPQSGITGPAGTKRKADDAQPAAAAKRKRSATPPASLAKTSSQPASAVKAEPTTSPVIKTEPVALKQGLVTIAELKEFVSKLGGTIPAVDLTKHYKNRLKSKEDKDSFRNAVKEGLHFNKITKTLNVDKPQKA